MPTAFGLTFSSGAVAAFAGVVVLVSTAAFVSLYVKRGRAQRRDDAMKTKALDDVSVTSPVELVCACYPGTPEDDIPKTRSRTAGLPDIPCGWDSPAKPQAERSVLAYHMYPDMPEADFVSVSVDDPSLSPIEDEADALFARRLTEDSLLLSQVLESRFQAGPRA